jgi:hypothetical protein
MVSHARSNAAGLKIEANFVTTCMEYIKDQYLQLPKDLSENAVKSECKRLVRRVFKRVFVLVTCITKHSAPRSA